MASPAKNSSYSSSIPCKTNSSMKKSELSDPMRRSFSGNPFTKPSVITTPRAFNPITPANSPSDFPRRHSTSRESVSSLRDPDKENDRDQHPKSTRVRSPAPSKGTKNFMSPTISAASKINASPKKKILVERNEPVRSSVSFSDVKSLIMEDDESNPEIDLKQKVVSFSDVKCLIMKDESKSEIGSNQKKVSFSDVNSIIMEEKESTQGISLNQKKVSFADVNSVVVEDNESTPQIVVNQRNGRVPHDSRSSDIEDEDPLKSKADFNYKNSKNDSDSLPETVTEEKDSVNVDPSFKISPRVSISPSCPTIAPLDADPLMPPYDPKTNYLSPRPQFLHYRPNPRIELYRERQGRQLDEHFASESYSDTDVTEESEGSRRESDDISSEETMKEGEEEEEELHLCEPNPMAPDMVEETFEAKRMSTKSRFFTRSKFITLLLFVAFACFSVLVANSPAFSPCYYGLEEPSLPNFQVPAEVTEFAKANFDRFTRNLQQWSASIFSYVSDIISNSGAVHNLGPVQYANLSHLVEEQQMFDHYVMGTVTERDVGNEVFNNKYQDIEADEAVDEEEEELEDQEDEAYENFELVSEEEPDEVQQEIEDEMIELDQLEETVEESKEVEFAAQTEADSHQSNVDLQDQPSTTQATEIKHDISRTGEAEADKTAETVFPKEEEAKSDSPKIEDSTDNPQSSEVADSNIKGSEDQLLSKNMMSFSLPILCLLAASAFIHIKRGKPSTPNASVPGEQPEEVGKISKYIPVSVGSKDTIRGRQSSENWQTEVDMSMTDESCPSEMSSYQRNSSSYSNKGLKESNEYQSQERKTRKTYRRESLASSDYSMGSSSYGSFTTYEKIPSKHGGGDEEIVTPVRRSSRIRSQVPSP